MKQFLVIFFSISTVLTALGQGFVDFRNGTTTNSWPVSTNRTVDIYGNLTGLSGTGLTSPNSIAPQGFYYALLMQPYFGGATNNPVASTLLSSGWLFAGIGGTNVTQAGRLSGGPSAQTLENDPTDSANQFVIVGWSSNVATNGLVGWLTVSNELSAGVWTTLNGLIGYFGISLVGTGVGSSDNLNPELLFGGATGIQSGFELDVVPEPATIALGGIGGLALLFFRRRCRK